MTQEKHSTARKRKKRTETEDSPQFFQRNISSLAQLYHLPLQPITTGGEGTIYKATTLEGEIRAVKEFHTAQDDDLYAAQQAEGYTGAITRFEREIAALVALGEKGITPKIYQAFYQRDETRGKLTPTIEMEWIPGETLAQVQQRGYDFSEQKTKEMLFGLLACLQEVHDQKLIHRDLNPHNIKLVGEDISSLAEAYKILDLSSSTVQEKKTRTLAIGTAEYAAPEQWEGDSTKVTKAADIYSLGRLAEKFLTEKPSAEFANILQKMTERKVEERYHSVEEVIVDLQGVSEKRGAKKKKREVEVSDSGIEAKIFSTTDILCSVADYLDTTKTKGISSIKHKVNNHLQNLEQRLDLKSSELFSTVVKNAIVHEFVPAYLSLREEYAHITSPNDILEHAWSSFWNGGIVGWLTISLVGESVFNGIMGTNYDLPGWYLGAGISFALPYLQAISYLVSGKNFKKEKKELIERKGRELCALSRD